MILLQILGVLILWVNFAFAFNCGRKSQNFVERDAETTLEDYEYVIVGSGPGGSPLAARLALAGHSVLLIDAGGDFGDDLTVQLPALHPYASEYDPIKWNYFVQHYSDPVQQARDSKLTYQNAAGDQYVGSDPPAGYEPLGILYPRTGALGGCSQHNALIAIKPVANDWLYIQTLTGDDSWAPDNMLAYFEKLEKCEYLPDSVFGHGFTGWLPTAVTNLELIVQDLKILSLVIAAATTMGSLLLGSIITTVAGLAEVLTLDINNPSPIRDETEALYQVPLTMNFPEYSRASPRDFVLAVANAKNADGTNTYQLDIQLNTLVTNIIFDTSGTTPKATGVEFLVGQSLYRADPRAQASNTSGTPGSVTATREIIISAGTFNTPQILKLSGIGAAAELSSFGIPLIVDLPGVGANMQDRYEIGVAGEADSEFSLLAPCTWLNGTDPCLEQWQDVPLLKGAYSTNGIAIAYLKHSTVAEQIGSPDLEIGGVPAYFNGYYPGYALNATRGKNVWTWLTLKAHSRNTAGTVTLKSANPRDIPNILFNSFAEGGDEDVQAVLEGVQFGIQAFKNLIPLDGGFTQIWPPPATTQTDDELRQFIRDEAWGHHASCSCPIGADGDPMAVLDSKFRVRGVDGLRVVDASAFPRIPGTYIVLPLYMLSEKAADAVLADV